MKIIGFSGPPHSGKDSIADAIKAQLLRGTQPVHKMSLAAPMRRVGMTLLGFDPLDDAAYARLKEEPQPLFARRESSGDVFQMGFETQIEARDDLRQFMIWLSERAIKPRYGQDFWGRLLYQEACALGLEDAIILVPDLGFHSEIQFFEDTICYGNFVTVQLVRPGCDFSKDSRNYVSGQQMMRYTNDETIEGAAETIIHRLRSSEFGWQL